MWLFNANVFEGNVARQWLPVAYEVGGGCSTPGLKSQGTLWFSRQAQVAQTFWMQKVYSIQWKIQGKLYFSGQAQVFQNSEWQKIYTVELV